MKGLFTGNAIDILVIQALFMPLIQAEIFNFVDSWNNHKICKQRNRADHPTGGPFMMYFYPAVGIENFGYQVEASSLRGIKSHVDDYGLYKLHQIT